MLKDILRWAAFWLLNGAVIAFVYLVWIRPLLKRTPALAWLWTREASVLAAVSEKLAGLKQKLTAAFVTMAVGVVYMHDTLAPMLVGVDTTPITSVIAGYVPERYWGIGLVLLLLLLNYFRSLAEKRGDM
ncbi:MULTISPECIES: hypothetical protein [unclassified Bradyrhizobium]|uniref:hypothetical protein n=1 Tax=unclassified Bradyrhizobium TaxID=2631580 RepID=UPI0028E19F68|nr:MULTISPECIES: hypothetical protein [unclassified Bradyrhizobium]